MKTAFAVSVLAFSLVGCIGSYVAPSGADIGTLVIVNNGRSGITPISFKRADDCSGGKGWIGKGLIQPGESRTVRVRGNEKFSFLALYNEFSYDVKYAREPVTFSPKPGGMYRFSFWSDGQKYSLSLESRENGTWVVEPTFQLRKWQTPILETGSHCEPISATGGLLSFTQSKKMV